MVQPFIVGLEEVDFVSTSLQNDERSVVRLGIRFPVTETLAQK